MCEREKSIFFPLEMPHFFLLRCPASLFSILSFNFCSAYSLSPCVSFLSPISGWNTFRHVVHVTSSEKETAPIFVPSRFFVRSHSRYSFPCTSSFQSERARTLRFCRAWNTRGKERRKERGRKRTSALGKFSAEKKRGKLRSAEEKKVTNECAPPLHAHSKLN